jgi:hypothetical protein
MVVLGDRRNKVSRIARVEAVAQGAFEHPPAIVTAQCDGVDFLPDVLPDVSGIQLPGHRSRRNAGIPEAGGIDLVTAGDRSKRIGRGRCVRHRQALRPVDIDTSSFPSSSFKFWARFSGSLPDPPSPIPM